MLKLAANIGSEQLAAGSYPLEYAPPNYSTRLSCGMALYHKILGQGPPLVVLHGLFGTSDNWATLARQWSEHFTVILMDLRNHGRSPHHHAMNYPLMAEDVAEVLREEWMHRVYLLGHSMGGKTAMRLALDHPDLVEQLMVVDIAPRAYSGGHEGIMEALLSIPLDKVAQRQDAEEMLLQKIPDRGVALFLLKNLARTKDGGFRWKMNLEAIHRHYDEIVNAIECEHPYPHPAMFVRGGRSGYITDEDWPAIRTLFPKATLQTIEGAGHWVHADQPEALSKLVMSFFGN